jgi:hypothetical protein
MNLRLSIAILPLLLRRRRLSMAALRPTPPNARSQP